MNNNFKHISLGFLFILLILVSITTVAAADINNQIQDSAGISEQDTAESGMEINEKTGENDKKVEKTTIKENKQQINKSTKKSDMECTQQKTDTTTSKSIKQKTAETFQDLQNKINVDRTGTVKLTKNYTRSSTDGKILLDKTITIDGQGYTLNANNMEGIFLVTTNVTIKNIKVINSNGTAIGITDGNVTLINITAINNTAGSGGVIYNNGTLTVNNGIYVNNTADYGGVCFNDENGVFIGNNGTYINNTATTGGGVYVNSGNLTFNNGTYANNSAEYGGVTYNNGYVTVGDGLFINNTASDSGGVNFNEGILTVHGGNFTANNAYIGGVNFNDFTMVINGGNFTVNSADYGGVNINVGNLTVNGGNFTSNSAEYGGVNYQWYDTLTINNGIFTNNTANVGGGVNYNEYVSFINDGLFANNTAYNAGVNYNYGGNLTVDYGIFTDNRATNAGVNYNFGNLTVNDGIFSGNNATIGGVTLNNDTLIIKNGVFSYNNAVNGSVLYNSLGKITIRNGLFSGNTGQYVLFTNNGTFIVVNSTFTNNVCNNTLFNEDMIPNKLSITNNTYTGNNLTTVLTVTPDTTDITTKSGINITVKPADIYNTTINTGNITLYENDGEIQTVPATDNTINYMPHEGEYDLIIKYGDSSNSYTSANRTIHVNITKLNTTITAALLNNTVTNVTLKINMTINGTTLPVDNGTIVILDEDGNARGNATLNETGIVTIKTDITDGGKHNLTIKYSGDNKYNNSTQLFEVNIMKIDTKVTLDPMENVKLGYVLTVRVSLTDNNGNVLSYKNIILQINNKKTSLTTNNNGTVTYVYKPKKAELLEITVLYGGDKTYAASDTTRQITVNKLPAILSVNNNITSRINDTVNITVNIVDENYSPVTGGRIIFKVNDKTLRDNRGNIVYATVKDGVASITTSFSQKVGSYTLIVIYGGTSYYGTSKNRDTSITITPRDAQITIDEILPAIIGSEMSFKVKVTDGDEPVNSGTVLIKFNDKSLRDTNGNVVYASVKKGEATVKFTISSAFKAKTYNLTVVYSDKSYNRVETTTPVEVINSTAETGVVMFRDNTPKAVKI